MTLHPKRLTLSGGNGEGVVAGTGEGNGGTGQTATPFTLPTAGFSPGGGAGGASAFGVGSTGGAEQIKMTFNPPPPPPTPAVSGIPTLSEYGLAALALLMAVAGLRQWRRRH